MDIRTVLSSLVQASLVLIVLAVGLRSRWNDLLYVLRRPALLVRGFLAVNVIVPATAVLFCWLLPVAPLTKAGLVIMAVSPLAPFAPGKMLKTGCDRAYVVGLYAALILAAVVVVPATFELLSLIAPKDVSIPIGIIARFVASSVLIPLVAGVIVGSLWPRFGDVAAKWGTIAAYVVLLPVVALLLAKSAPAMISLAGDGTIIAIVLTVVAGIAAGQRLGGPEPAHRAVLVEAAITRHPGMAALILRQHFQDRQAIMAVLLFLIMSILVARVYSIVEARMPRRHNAAVPDGGRTPARDEGFSG